jgi:hypothetical protein
MLKPRRKPALRQGLDVPVREYDARSLKRSPQKAGHGHGEDHRGAAVAAFTALAAVGIDRQPDHLAREVIRMRLAVDQQQRQREDRGVAGVDELCVQFLQRDFGTRQLRPQGGDRFDRHERIGASRRVKDGEPVRLVMDDVVASGREAAAMVRLFLPPLGRPPVLVRPLVNFMARLF